MAGATVLGNTLSNASSLPLSFFFCLPMLVVQLERAMIRAGRGETISIAPPISDDWPYLFAQLL